MEKTMNIEGMSCPHCVARVQKALEGINGVKKVSVNLKTKTAVIKGEPLVDEALVDAVAKAGYEGTVV